MVDDPQIGRQRRVRPRLTQFQRRQLLNGNAEGAGELALRQAAAPTNALDQGAGRAGVARIGLAYGAQIVDEVPQYGSDQRMHFVVTEDGVIGIDR